MSFREKANLLQAKTIEHYGPDYEAWPMSARMEIASLQRKATVEEFYTTDDITQRSIEQEETAAREAGLRQQTATCRDKIFLVQRATRQALGAPRGDYGVIDPFMAQSALEEIWRIVGAT